LDCLNPQHVQLAKIFTWRGWGYITAPNQPKPPWTTSKIPLHSGILIDTYVDPTKLIGIGFDRDTDYLMGDIDRGSPYHPMNNWTRWRDFLRCMASIGLRGKIILRSSSSGGIHVYFPLPKFVNSIDLAIAAKVASIDDGFDVASGKLEFFPNVKHEKSRHTRHRVPLQPDTGACLLDVDGKAVDIPAPEQLAAFIQQWEDATVQQDMRLLSRKIRQLGSKYLVRKNSVKYKLDRQLEIDDGVGGVEFNRSLDRLIEIGWTACDQTQKIVVNLLKKAVIFLRLQGEDAVNWIVSTARTMGGYDRYCAHKHDIRKVAASWVKSCEDRNYYLPYCGHPARDGKPISVKHHGSPRNANYKKSADQARLRIEAAVVALSQLQVKFTTIESLISAIQDRSRELFGMTLSRTTLRKYTDLWHPKIRHWIWMPGKNGSDLEPAQLESFGIATEYV
jgi:hypothetical protein